MCVHVCDLCLYACKQTVTLNPNLTPLSLDNIFSESETINACYLNLADCIGFPGSTSCKERLPIQETEEMWVQSLGWEDP